MRYHKGRGDGNSLMQVAAAVVGSAAASQHIPTEPQHAHELRHACPVPGCRWPMNHEPQCSPEVLAEVREVLTRINIVGGVTARQVRSAMRRKVDIGWIYDAFEHLEIIGEVRRDDGRFFPVERPEPEPAGAQHAHTLGMPCPVGECRWPAPDRATLEAEWERVDPEGVASLRAMGARVAELEQAAPAAALDVHAALNTYEVAADVPEVFEQVTPHMALTVGANHRKLIARWDVDGLWIGGCLITDREVAGQLAAFITREAEDD